MRPRASVLVVVSSSCQLYSGTGTALFDWMRYAAAELDFSLLVDTSTPLNFQIAARFCRETGVALLPSEGEHVPGCPDVRPSSIARTLRSRPWDIIECVSWASAATNMDVLANRPAGSKLIFTPHTQPIWTLAGHSRYFLVRPVLARMLAASDLVLLDTASEISHMLDGALDPACALQVPLGVDTNRFRPPADGAAHGPPRLLAVADFREHRKRPDLLLRALELTLAARPDVLPVLAGRDSDRLELPRLMSARCERLGYVSADELLWQYRSATAFLLLSDFEAFGLPIAEALCCGTPVVMHAQDETIAAFGDLPGVHAVLNTALNRVRDALLACAAAPPDRVHIASAAADRFSLTATYGRKLDRVLKLLNTTQCPHAMQRRFGCQ